MTTPYSEPWEGKTRALPADASPQPTPTPPIKSTLDQELAAMRTINAVLSRLDPATRSRVLSWVSAHVHAMQAVPASATLVDGDTPWPSHTVDDIRPLSRDELGRDETKGPDYEWPTVSVYLKETNPIRDSEGDEYTVADARQFAAYLLSAAHRVDTHTETT